MICIQHDLDANDVNTCHVAKREPEFILASQSPRRQELLALAGFTFFGASRPDRRGPPQRRRSRGVCEETRSEKAHAAWERLGKWCWWDTIVVVGDRVLEKPRMPRKRVPCCECSPGAEHVVITGICWRNAGGADVDPARTLVRCVEMAT